MTYSSPSGERQPPRIRAGLIQVSPVLRIPNRSPMGESRVWAVGIQVWTKYSMNPSCTPVGSKCSKCPVDVQASLRPATWRRTPRHHPEGNAEAGQQKCRSKIGVHEPMERPQRQRDVDVFSAKEGTQNALATRKLLLARVSGNKAVTPVRPIGGSVAHVSSLGVQHQGLEDTKQRSVRRT